MSIEAKNATKIAEIAINLAKKEGKEISVSVADCAGEELCFMTTDSADIQTRAIAKRKAYTSARTGRNTGENAKLREKKGQQLAWFDPNYTGLQGGVVLKSRHEIVGAIGVSGLQPEEDEALAQKAFKLWQKQEKAG